MFKNMCYTFSLILICNHSLGIEVVGVDRDREVVGVDDQKVVIGVDDRKVMIDVVGLGVMIGDGQKGAKNEKDTEEMIGVIMIVEMIIVLVVALKEEIEG
jgi:hypothetical protein